MKNSLKYIATCFTFYASMLVSGGTALAQPYQVVNGIGFNKTATDNEDGTFTIDLEAFVMGKVAGEVQPSDIALVLDLSGSMLDSAGDGTYIKPTKISYALVRDRQVDKSTKKGFDYYYKDGDTYYKFNIGTHRYELPNGSGRSTRYYIYYTKNSVNYYLGANGAEAVTMFNESTETWTQAGIEHSVTSTGATLLWDMTNVYRTMDKLELLKDASIKFVNTIADNNPTEGESHMVAIVIFSGTSSSETRTVKDFTSIATGKDELISAIQGLRTGSDTRTDLGVNVAITDFNNLAGRDRMPDFMVVFTDGNPGTSTFDSGVASDAINATKPFKEAGGTVFAVGMIANASSDTHTFMNRLSSNYPHASGMTGDAGTPDPQGGYYIQANGANLTSIFENIAQQASAVNTAVTAEAAVTVDVVTTSFDAPTNASAVSVKVAPCIGEEGGYLIFGEPKTAEEYGLPHITVNPIQDNTVSTTGFDYSGNFCGPDGQGGYTGYKQIISFVITINDSATGGPSVATNAPTSGIYINDEQLLPFNIPHVKVPVQIWIEKRGLVGDDSAVFTIYYSKSPSGPWTHFTKVVLNNSVELKSALGYPMVKITGLEPTNYYRIKEDAWSWSYTVDNPVRYTSEVINNPFIFVNTPRDIKETEDGVRNVFNDPANLPSSK